MEMNLLTVCNRDRTINSIVLLSNGISFAIQIVIFLLLGSFAGIYHSTFLEMKFPNISRFRNMETKYSNRVISDRLGNWFWMARCS